MKKKSGLDASGGGFAEIPVSGMNTVNSREPTTVGAEFTKARKRQSITLDTVARDLNIGKEFLAAIENDDIENLPEPAYAIGFVRSYARYLDIDAAEMIVRFKAETLSKRDVEDLYLLTPMRERRLPTGLLAIISVVVAGLAYGSWELYTQQADGQHAGGATVAARQGAATKPADRLEARAAPAGETRNKAAGAPPASLAKAKDDPTTVAEKRTAEAPKAKSGGPVAPPQNTADARADKPAGNVTAKVHSGNGQQQVVLRATSSTWIRIRDAGNTILFTRVLREGDQYVVPKKDGIVVDIGNAGGLQIVLNGKVLKPVGPANMPVYNISLSPKALKKREEAANTGRAN